MTATQIRSLFSTFTRQLKDGTLKPPTKKANSNNQDVEEIQNVVQPGAIDETIEEYHNVINIDVNYRLDLSKEVQEVMSSISDWAIDDCCNTLRIIVVPR